MGIVTCAKCKENNVRIPTEIVCRIQVPDYDSNSLIWVYLFYCKLHELISIQ
jgi:hypothetical protein